MEKALKNHGKSMEKTLKKHGNSMENHGKTRKHCVSQSQVGCWTQQIKTNAFYCAIDAKTSAKNATAPGRRSKPAAI